jgi:hypothetical protein
MLDTLAQVLNPGLRDTLIWPRGTVGDPGPMRYSQKRRKGAERRWSGWANL